MSFRVFVSYSHKDERYLNKLRAHLANLREEGLISLWHDGAIQPGSAWEPTVLQALEEADVIVLLISPDFNASQFCRQVEMALAIERHQQGTAKVIPVLVRKVEALPAEIAPILAIPKNTKPITSFKPQDKGYVEVARGIREVLESMTETTREESPESHLVIDIPDTRPLIVSLEFQLSNGDYQAEVQIGAQSAQKITLPDVLVGPSERLRLGEGVEATLGDLVQRLIDFKPQDLAWFEERGQLEIGRKLFDETVGRIQPLASLDQVDLRIVTDDEHLMRLPWPLLNRRGIFLIHEAWTTSLSTRGRPLEEVALSSSPNVLIINPDPDPNFPTNGADHVNDLRSLLSGEDYDLGSREKMVEVRTWSQLKKTLAEKTFEVVYYYGHAQGGMDSCRLLFESSGNRKAELHSIPDLANLLRKLNPVPTLAYVNCCRGDSSGLLGIGNQLGSFILSVVTNRTVARVSAAQKHACSFFRQVLLDSVPPHAAVASLYHEMPGEDLNGIQPEWFTPVHHANYSAWNHVSPRDSRKPRINPNWRWLVDRKNQYGTTTERLRSMVNRQINKRALAIVVHGAPGNGLSHFQQRIRGFVHESVGVDGKTYRPSWAPYQATDEHDVALRNRSFMHIIESCGRPTIPELVRDLRHGVPGNKVLTVLNHSIISSPKILSARSLFEYVEWWDHKLGTEVDDDNLFFLFAFYFEVPEGRDNRQKFKDRIKAARRKVHLQYTDVEFLLPLTEIDEDDLLQFIDDHELFIPKASREQIATHIISKTDGEYERAVALLDLIVHEQYQTLLHDMKDQQVASESSDW